MAANHTHAYEVFRAPAGNVQDEGSILLRCHHCMHMLRVPLGRVAEYVGGTHDAGHEPFTYSHFAWR